MEDHVLKNIPLNVTTTPINMGPMGADIALEGALTGTLNFVKILYR